MEQIIYSKYKDPSDVHVINKMVKNFNFKTFEIDNINWFDIGNSSELSRTRKYFHSGIEILDKKDETIFFIDNYVIKFFANDKINNNRVKRSFKLGNLVPNIVDYSKNFYKYEKVEGNLFSKSVTNSKFKNFLEWSNINLWNHKEKLNFKEICNDFYIKKTKKRIKQYLKSDIDKEELINGELIPSIYELINKIDSDWLCDGIPSQFHGDFILDNIIETDGKFTLIDWRQDFAGELDIGDIYYDLAKLNHNLTVNHDIVNNKLYNYSTKNCFIMINSKLSECKEELYLFIKKNGYDLRKVEMLTALIWLNMSPLHEHPFNKFLFTFGKYNLFKNIIKYD